MPQKTFSLYSPSFDVDHSSDQFFFEISNTHMACVVKKEETQQVVAFELFTFSQQESKNFENLFLAINMGSKLFDKVYKSNTLFVNNEYAQLIPIAKFNIETAKDFLELIHGDDKDAKIYTDDLPEGLDMVNTYRVPADWLEVIEEHLLGVHIKHTFSSIVTDFFTSNAGIDFLITVRFYHQHFIAAVFTNHKFHFIQYYQYQTKEDVLYHLLNMMQQFGLSMNDLVLDISGMIDLNSSLYAELVKYFSNIIVADINIDKVAFEIDGHPLHYFTPFFKLSV